MGTNLRGIMSRTCRAPGCRTLAASRFAAYCEPHRATLRRHGAVDQKAITKAHIKTYLKLAKARIAKNPGSEAWTTLDARWRALVDHAQAILAARAAGRADVHRASWTEIRALAAVRRLQYGRAPSTACGQADA